MIILQTAKPYRVLHVVAALDRGGTETMIMNHYRKIDRNIIQFDFLVNYPHKGEFEEEIENLGGRIYRTIPIRPWNYIKYFKILDDFFSEHSNYIAVHSHIQDNSGFVLKYAAKHGIKCRIAHSHVANFKINYKFPFFLFGRYYLHKFVNQRLACGNSAGKFMFGESDYTVFHNAIDASKFIFNPEIRHIKRVELGISEDQFVIANVARFHPQKNHQFILRVFQYIHQIDKKALLILCGSGDRHLQIMKNYAEELGLGSNVMFLGSRSDISQLMQAFDVIFMPSLFEGLPVSIIEAQAAGLPCVLSDSIDPETAITNLVHFIPLNQSIQEWIDAIISTKNMIRKNMHSEICKAGYDVQINTNIITNFYLSQL